MRRRHSSRRTAAIQHGFTLVEVLIALAILAIALAATSRAAALATTSAAESKARTAATWVAQNRIAELIARRAFPSAGTETGEVQMLGGTYQWTQTAKDSPNPAFRKVTVSVVAPARDERTIATLSVYLTRPPAAPTS